MISLTSEQETTIRFQLLFGLGLMFAALLTFVVVSQIWVMDIKYIVLSIGALVAIGYLKDSLIMLSDVAITVMKMRGSK